MPSTRYAMREQPSDRTPRHSRAADIAARLRAEPPRRFDVIDAAIERLAEAPAAGSGLVAATETLTANLGGCAAAVLLAGDDGLRIAAACTASLPALLCVDAACTDGPAHTAYVTGRSAIVHRIHDTRRSTFPAAAETAGFASAYGLPVAGRDGPIGALLVLAAQPYALDRSTTTRLRALTSAIAAVHTEEHA